MSDVLVIALRVQVGCLAGLTILAILAPTVVPMLFAGVGIVAAQVFLSE